MVLPGFRQGFSGPALLRVLLGNACIPDTGLSPSVAALSKAFFYTNIVHIAALQPQWARPLVWPLPRSLATTCGITFVFFSSSYLDVSVRRVDNFVHRSSICGVSPFGHARINRSFAPTRAFSQLTASFVVPKGAKASPMRPYSLPTLCLQWRIRDSNPGPPACKAGALAS
jgi:hypothetical protein